MIGNYARALELKPYQSLNESLIQEADANPADALAKVKSGMNGGTYKNQWDQLVKEISTKVDAGTMSGTFMVKHDDSVGGKDMVNVAWSVDANGKVTLAVASQNTGSVSDVVKKAAEKILVALVGSAFTEDEEAVYAVFRDDIKSDSDLKSLISYWKSQHVPYIPGHGHSFNGFADMQKFYKSSKSTDSNVGLEYWLGRLFNAEEINKVNDYISKYSQFRFKTI